MEELINNIKQILKIEGGHYIDMALEDYIKDIDPQDYGEFFKNLNGDDFAYKTGMDRVAMVSALFNKQKRALLMRNVPNAAKELVDKIYALKMQLPSDFSNMDIKTIKNKDENYFANIETVIIEKLGGVKFIAKIDTGSQRDHEAAIEREMEKIKQAVANEEAIGLNIGSDLAINKKD
jgi:hypothetical protein